MPNNNLAKIAQGKIHSRQLVAQLGMAEQTAPRSAVAPTNIKPLPSPVGFVGKTVSFAESLFGTAMFLLMPASFIAKSSNKKGVLGSVGRAVEAGMQAKPGRLAARFPREISTFTGNTLTTIGATAQTGINAVKLNGWQQSFVRRQAGKAYKAYSKALTHLSNAETALQGAGHIDARAALYRVRSEFMAAGAAGIAPERLSTVMTAFDEKMGNLTGAVAKDARKSIGTFVKNNLKAHSHYNAATFMRDIPGGLRGLQSRFANMSVSELVGKGFYVTSQANTLVSTVRLFGIGPQQDMYEAGTGKKAGPFFFIKVWTGNLPPFMKNMHVTRDYWLSALPRTVANIFSMAVFRYFHRGSGGGMLANGLGMGLQTAVTAGGNFLAGQDGPSTDYIKLVTAEVNGVSLPAGAYLGFLIHSLPPAMQSDPALLERVSQQYAQEHRTVRELLHELDNGAFIRRLQALKVAPPANENKGVEVANDMSAQKSGPVTIGSMTINPKPAAKAVAPVASTHAERVALKTPTNDSGITAVQSAR